VNEVRDSRRLALGASENSVVYFQVSRSRIDFDIVKKPDGFFRTKVQGAESTVQPDNSSDVCSKCVLTFDTNMVKERTDVEN
jgi:hypothetical protein